MDKLDAPVYRVRISHAHTLKDGWRCDSTTVECTFSGDERPDVIEGQLAAWMARAYNLGDLEAVVRNGADAENKRTE